MVGLGFFAWLAAAGVSTVLADSAPTCGPNNLCPDSAPCCSPYGQCGVGAYCLGGCDIRYSHSIDSCAAAPSCKSSDYKLTGLDDVMPNTKYLGDPTKANWVSEGAPLAYDNSLLLTMPANSVGTLLSSTRYVWYGKISTTMKSSSGAGVVTAFIMMSDVHDEIDFEFVGTDLQAVQSNYYWQGTLNYTNSANLSASNTNTDSHTYTVDWQPDTLTWSVDGNVLRTLNKADTWNSTTNSYQYPQTPSRIQLSLWPAGESQNGQGTVEWAGGLINWNSPDMTNGYYSAQVMEVDVQCYNPPPGAQTSGNGAYIYTDTAGLNTSVALTNNQTTLASFFATGENPGANPNSASASGASSTASASGAVNTNAQTVPGVSSGGARGNDGSDTLNSGSSSGSSSSSGSGSSGSSSGGTNGQFIQGTSSTGSGSGSTNNASAGKIEQVRSGSVVAVLIAIVALVML